MSLENFRSFVDVDRALSRLMDDESLFLGILYVFLEEFKNERERFSDLISTHQSKEVSNLAHYFKGIAANLEIFNVFDLTTSIEQASNEEDWLAVANAFGQLCDEVVSVSSVYEKIKQ
jgi:HPt (histidine-containing phosphotransfer) domain-containing protein